MIQNCAGMWQTICRAGKRPFIITPEQKFSYADLHAAVLRWLALFDDAEMAEGDRILIRSSHEFSVISCFIASLLDGKVPVTLTIDTKPARLAAIAASAEAQCMVDDANDLPEGLQPGLHHFTVGQTPQDTPRPGLLARLTGNDTTALTGLPPVAASREPALPEYPDGLAYLLFTSGTTSAPTGVQLTRGNLFANLATLSRLLDYGPDARIFNDMILAHADGMIQGPMLALANGCALIRSGGFTIAGMEQWLGQVRACRATHFITVPTVWAMIDAYAAHDDYFDAPELTSLQSVAAKLPEELWRRLETRFGHHIVNHYGLTETVASALYAGPHPEMGSTGTIGRPVDCEARIDPQAAVDVQGELQLRGTNVFPAYWRDEERTNASFTDDGWLRTGDLAVRNEDGSFSILGRLKNIIMSGGFLIRPEEIDEVMLTHDAVRESVSLALEDATFGEIAATAIVLDGTAGRDELLDHARTHLEAQKVPRHFAIVDAIARGISGKPKLAEVKAQLLAVIGPDQSAQSGHGDLGRGDLGQSILALAADVFRVPVDQLSFRTGPEMVNGWDSFSHLNLVLETERQFGITISAAHIASIETLEDLHSAVAELMA